MNFFDSVSSSIKWVDEYINHINCETKMISASTLLKIMKNKNNTVPVFNKQCPRTSDPSHGWWSTQAH